MELLCGVPSKPQRGLGSWGTSWGRTSLRSSGKVSASGKHDGDRLAGWGVKRSVTLPSTGSRSLGSMTASAVPLRCHLMNAKTATLPVTARTPLVAMRDPYNQPFDAVLIDDSGLGEMKRSSTLPPNALRKGPTCLSGPVAKLKRNGSFKKKNNLSREGSIRKKPLSREGSFKRNVPPDKDQSSLKCADKEILSEDNCETKEENAENSDTEQSDSVIDLHESRDTLIEDSEAEESIGNFRRTRTLPLGVMCRSCPVNRNSDRRKLSFVHSKEEIPETCKEESEDSISNIGTKDSSGSIAWRNSSWRGKRHSTASSMVSMSSRATSATTTTDEGICVYSEAGSMSSSSAYGSASFNGDGSSVYSAPSVTSTDTSLSSLYERFGARPKMRSNHHSHHHTLEGAEEKCLRCKREEQMGSSTFTRRAKSFRSPRHLPVTPTLLRLLQLGLEQVGGSGDQGVTGSNNSSNVGVQRREKPHPPRTDAHRFSRANLEDSGDVELDAILGELCALETQFEFEISSKNSTSESSLAPSPLRSSLQSTTPGILDKMQPKSAVQGVPVVGTVVQQQQQQQPTRPSHSRSNSGTRNKFTPDPRDTDVDINTTTIVRTDSPDNDSAFSDNVSMLSSESSASSGASGGAGGNRRDPNKHSSQAEQAAKMKAEKIKMALEKIKEANVKKLFIKAFTSDGSTKSLLVDEKMTIYHVTRLLADKNHVRMDPKWAIIEHIPDLYMERIYEDDEMLVENLLLWTRDSKNKLIFVERPDKYDLFLRPEHYLLVGSFSQKNEDLDDESRGTLIEEFFSSTGCGVPEVEGALFLKSEGKKVWKKYYFVLRASGLYYCPKGKSSRSSKDLVCLTTLEVNQVYYGVGWKKKYKAPSDHCFAIKHPHLQAKSSKYIKYLCAEDSKTLTQWVMGIRIAKSGKRLRENYTTLVEDLAQEDIDMLASSRSFSIASMAGRSDLGSRGASQATTPSSESRSLDSCLAPSLTPSVIDDDEGDDNISSAGSSSLDTPVNTLGRAPVWRQESMKSGGSSSSSSGCLSERSSAGTPTGEHGFESDFPQGTIKRKPSSAPKLPLTSTTRLLVKEVDGEDVIDAASRASTLRQSMRRSLTEEVNTIRRENKRSSVTPSRISVTSNQSSNLSCNASIVSSNQSCNASIVSSNQSCNDSIVSSNQSCNISSVSSNQSCNISIVSSSVSNVSSVSLSSLAHPEETVDNLPLPPPPLELSGTDAREMALLPPPPPELLASTLSLNSLPPPPEEADYPAVVDPEELMMASITSLPPPPPPSPPKISSPTKGDLPPPPPTTPKPAPKTPPKPSSPICGGVAPIYQTGSPIYQSGSSSPIYQSGRSTPIYQSGTSTPVYHSGPGSPVYQSGTASPVYQTSQNSHIYQTGGCSPIYGTNINHSGASPVYQALTPPSVAPKPRRDSGNDSNIYSSPPYLQELRSVSVIAAAQQNGSWHQEQPQHPEIPLPPPPPPASAGEHPVYAQPQKSPQKKVKRITFQDDVQNIPPAPQSPISKPPLPRRSESTRLSAMNPGRLDTPGCKVTPPKAFLNNLQRVMQKKWQVAQKCKDLDMKAHEVLGFRDPVLPSESERNVGAWIQEHYGSLYENLSPLGTPQHQSVVSQDTVRQNSQTLKPAAVVPGHSEENYRLSQTTPCRKKPPPPPPKRSDSTQLSTRQ